MTSPARSFLSRWHVASTAVVSALAVIGCTHSAGQAGPVSRVYEQSYLRASHNWAFRRQYPNADHLFNAFDYGHAKLSEILYTRPDAPREVLDRNEFRYITEHVLTEPPVVPLEERAIAPHFSRLAPELELMFEWAHMLHRQLYDVWADDHIPERAKDDRVAELIRYYRSRPDLALSAVPKTMAPMEERPYSTAFRRRYPTFNGLIWSYHWLQLALYEALMSDTQRVSRRSAVRRTIARFDAMIACPTTSLPTTSLPTTSLPTTMPLAAAVAPHFEQRYPEAAAIFDNLHSLHDVVSDILASRAVPAARKREILLKAAAEFRDPTVDATTVAASREMAHAMGVDDMGGLGTPFEMDTTASPPCRRP